LGRLRLHPDEAASARSLFGWLAARVVRKAKGFAKRLFALTDVVGAV
jgi:Na+/H+ antiporter NhaD/arsenite permease-like protein